MRAEGAVLGGEQSGHIITLDGHVTGDGLAAALLLCRALDGGSLAAAASVLELLPQAKENIRVDRPGVSPALAQRGGASSRASSPGRGRILVRASGTEPLDPGARRVRKRGGGSSPLW